MDKVSLYVKRILALGLSGTPIVLSIVAGLDLSLPGIAGLAAIASLVFAYLDFRINGDKPRFLFGMNQSDAYLNGKGGFWNLFKWIVHLFGFIYDLVVWAIWGVL